MLDDGSQSWYDTAQGYISAVGNSASEVVSEVYEDASDAGGYTLGALNEIFTAPGKALQSFGRGAEAAGTGFGKGVESAGSGLGISTPLIVAGLAGFALYFGLKK